MNYLGCSNKVAEEYVKIYKTDEFNANERINLLQKLPTSSRFFEHLEFILNIIEREARYRDYIDVEVKYQLRDLDTFINPNISEKDNKHIGRFRSTRFDENEWKRVISMTKERNLKPLVTVFDENSVDFAKELGVKNIKVASCSAQEWVLLEKILKASPDKVTISTGGKTLEQIDKYIFFMSRDYTSIELMHCCAIYPAPLDAIALSNIEVLKRRYLNIKIGYSGHETERKGILDKW